MNPNKNAADDTRSNPTPAPFVARKQLFQPLSLFVLIVLLSLAGCSLNGAAITSSGTASDPQLAYNGSHFAIAYYHRSQPGNPFDIRIIKVANNGNIVVAGKKVATLSGAQAPFRLSNLVWNNDNQQFAFAYSLGKAAYFVRLDAQLNTLGQPLEIKFGLQPHEHPYLEDLSVVWNSKDKEYGVAFVTREYIPGRQDDVYLSRVSPSGNFIGPYARHRIIDCPSNCKRTSLAHNPQTGKYALAYFYHQHPRLALFTPGGSVVQHKLSPETYVTAKESIGLVYDPVNGDFYVSEVQYGGELIGYIVSKSGSLIKADSKGKGYDKIFSLSPYLPSPSAHQFLIAAAQYQQTNIWLMTDKGHMSTDWISPTAGVYTTQPSVAVVGVLPYLAWIQDSKVRFGHPEEK